MRASGTQSANTFEAFYALTRIPRSFGLRSHRETIHAGETVGFNAHDLIGMLDRGMTFEELLELIESKMECSQKAA